MTLASRIAALERRTRPSQDDIEARQVASFMAMSAEDQELFVCQAFRLACESGLQLDDETAQVIADFYRERGEDPAGMGPLATVRFEGEQR